MKTTTSSKFERSLKKLSGSLVEKVVERALLFKKDPFDSRLKTHKLHGKLKDKWSFSVDTTCRVLFEFDGAEIIFLDIGDHDLYK